MIHKSYAEKNETSRNNSHDWIMMVQWRLSVVYISFSIPGISSKNFKFGLKRQQTPTLQWMDFMVS